MQNNRTRLFMKKHGAALIFSLCLVGAAAFTTVYTLNHAEKNKEQQEQFTDLEEEARIQEANAARIAEPNDEAKNDTDDEGTAVNGSNLVDELEENPEDLLENGEAPEDAQDVSSGNVTAALEPDVLQGTLSPTVNFTEDNSLDWPVAGNVLLDYSMDGSIYFPTLQVYKYNPALIIGAQVGSQVVAAAKGIVDSIEVDEETGTTITMNIGNNYALTYGQLKEVPVNVGDVVEEGALLGYVSEPTKYYCTEGSNLYFKMTKDGVPVDPFLYLGE